jgi:Tfp pilus assembly major pilin PilA
MDTRVTKKRKLEDGTATDSAIDVEEYNYQPIRLKTLKQNLEAIPHEALIRTLVSIAQKDLTFIETLNDAIPLSLDPSSRFLVQDDPDEHLLEDAQDNENKFEMRQFSPKKIKDYIDKIFQRHTYHKSWSYGRRYVEEDEDDFIDEYKKLIAKLEALIMRANTLYKVGEYCSAYIILRVMSEEVDENRIATNGTYEDNDDMDPPGCVPEEVCDLRHQVKEDMSEEEINYCKDRLSMYEAEKPTEDHNTFVFANFPLRSSFIKTNYEASYMKCKEYVGKFKVKSKISIQSTADKTETQFMIFGSVPGVHKDGYYKQELHFTATELLEEKCSCPVGSTFCKHIAGLAVQVYIEKKKILAMMSGNEPVQATVTSTKNETNPPRQHPKTTLFGTKTTNNSTFPTPQRVFASKNIVATPSPTKAATQALPKALPKALTKVATKVAPKVLPKPQPVQSAPRTIAAKLAAFHETNQSATRSSSRNHSPKKSSKSRK